MTGKRWVEVIMLNGTNWAAQFSFLVKVIHTDTQTDFQFATQYKMAVLLLSQISDNKNSSIYAHYQVIQKSIPNHVY